MRTSLQARIVPASLLAIFDERHAELINEIRLVNDSIRALRIEIDAQRRMISFLRASIERHTANDQADLPF